MFFFTGCILGQAGEWVFWFERAPNQKACILTQRFWGKAEISPSLSQDASTRYLTVAVHVVSCVGRWMWLQPYVLEMSILRWSSRRLCVYPSCSSLKQSEIPKFPSLKLEGRSYSTEKGCPFRAQCRFVVSLSTGKIQDLQHWHTQHFEYAEYDL